MKKKILLGLGALALAVVTVPMFAAFEAHVINVTATIENALSVDPKEIKFGVVFPQEILKESLTISLSESFLSEDRADDVKYVIKQKPKVKGDPYAIIHPDNYQDGIVAHEYCLNELEKLSDPANLEQEYYQYCYPNLSAYLSKHKADDDDDMPTDVCITGQGIYDCEVDAPNPNWKTDHAFGYLVKSVDDDVDKWVIDLVVPCFSGSCDQTYNPAIYGTQLDPRLEHQVFGTDLWIEVLSISENHAQCGDDIDNDGDGYIDFDGGDSGCINEFDNSEQNGG